MSYTLSEVTEFIGTITLDHERRRNALSHPLWVICRELWHTCEVILVPRGVPCRATRTILFAHSLRMSARSYPA